MNGTTRRSSVLVVAWDGVRDDERRAARTPHLDAVGATGFLTPVRVDPRNPTWSGPVWTTVFTGVYSDAHGVRSNDFSSNRFDLYPDVITRLLDARPDASAFACGEWAPLFTTDSGGPLFPHAAHRPALAGDAPLSLDTIAAMDEATTGRVAAELLTHDHTIVFAYLVLPDMVGHDQGVTPAYREAIERCDAQLGVLLAAISARPTRADEDWTVIVLTDHGHRDEGHHGGDSDAERIAWIAASGPGLTSESAVGVDHADVAAHVLATVGVAVAGSPLAGVPFGRRATSRAATAPGAAGSPTSPAL